METKVDAKHMKFLTVSSSTVKLTMANFQSGAIVSGKPENCVW